MPDLIVLARIVALKHALDPALVCAVVEQESGWNPWAIRFEASFERRYVRPALPSMPTTDELGRAVSWGLMQVMGEVAREHGFTERYFTALCEPSVGLEVGCRVLSHKLLRAQGDVTEALSLWNGGSNGSYASEVLQRHSKYVSTINESLSLETQKC